MIQFDTRHTDMFLATVRKYMQLRGGMSQKDLAEEVGIGISSMSRFLNQKTKEIDPQLIALIIAKLNIPLHEVIDFVEEGSTEKFKKLLAFYKDEPLPEFRREDDRSAGNEKTRTVTKASIGGVKVPFGEQNTEIKDMTIKEKLGTLSARQRGFLTDFLDLDAEGRDLIVDLGNSLFRYFKQSKIKF